ncbi:MAG: peptidoglycan editing factor PgeF [Woeseia sp.]
MSAPWIAAEWPAPQTIVAGTTLRTGGVSNGAFASLNLAAHVGDDPASVVENRRRFRSSCELPQEPNWLRQVHGTQAVRANSGPTEPEADAIVTTDAGVVCAVLTADCLPVVLASEDGNEVAAAHAGWRGLSAGILETTVAAFRAKPEHILAWFGPAISKPAFEVGAEVREQFVRESGSAAQYFSENDMGRWQADLYGLATLRLDSCGVRRVFGCGCCTHAEPRRFFSFRRDGRCGRMATFVFRRNAG